MNKTLSRINQKLHDKAAVSHIDSCEVWNRGGFWHLCFESTGCRLRANGTCTMCNYGAGRRIATEDALAQLREVLHGAGRVEELLLGTCGSIFDEAEMRFETLEALTKAVAAADVDLVIFETHYTTVSDQILGMLKKYLADAGKGVVIELGFESADPFVLENCINKWMDLEQLERTMDRIRGYGFHTVLNVFFGAPFLTLREQMDDAKEACEWAMKHGAANIVLFPANIKQDTLLDYLYRTGRYPRLSQWSFVRLLDEIPEDYLNRITLSWFGDRQQAGEFPDILEPSSCRACRDVIQAFYLDFMRETGNAGRKRLIGKLLQKTGLCGCYERMTGELERQRDGSREEQVLSRIGQIDRELCD